MEKSAGKLRKHFDEITNRALLWLLSKSEVARCDGIIICDPEESEQFRTTIIAALQLVKDTDQRRFERIKKHLKWILKCTLDEPSAQYRRDIQACVMDFTFAQLKSDSEMNAAYFAKVLVHESTHGVVASRGIRYAPELRLRIEKLCVTEENRFLNRLALTHPEIAENLHQDFDPTRWEKSWKISRGGSTLRVFYRLFFK